MKHSLIFLLCVLIVSCGASSDSSSSSSGANSSFSQSDLSGTWVGKLTPDNPNDKFRLLYFEATANGEVAEAADSVGNEWYNINATISADLLSNGELIMDFSSDSGPKKLHMEGNMTNSMSSIRGSYNYENIFGLSAVAHSNWCYPVASISLRISISLVHGQAVSALAIFITSAYSHSN